MSKFEARETTPRVVFGLLNVNLASLLFLVLQDGLLQIHEASMLQLSGGSITTVNDIHLPGRYKVEMRAQQEDLCLVLVLFLSLFLDKLLVVFDIQLVLPCRFVHALVFWGLLFCCVHSFKIQESEWHGRSSKHITSCKFKMISFTRTATPQAPRPMIPDYRTHNSILYKMKHVSQTALWHRQLVTLRWWLCEELRECSSSIPRFSNFDFTLMNRQSISTGLGILITVLISTVVTGYSRYCSVRGEIPDFDDLNHCAL